MKVRVTTVVDDFSIANVVKKDGYVYIEGIITESHEEEIKMKYKATVHSMMVQKVPEGVMSDVGHYNALLILNLTEPLVGINLNDISGMSVEFEILEEGDGTKTGGL